MIFFFLLSLVHFEPVIWVERERDEASDGLEQISGLEQIKGKSVNSASRSHTNKLDLPIPQLFQIAKSVNSASI